MSDPRMLGITAADSETVENLEKDRLINLEIGRVNDEDLNTLAGFAEKTLLVLEPSDHVPETHTRMIHLGLMRREPHEVKLVIDRDRVSELRSLALPEDGRQVGPDGEAIPLWEAQDDEALKRVPTNTLPMEEISNLDEGVRRLCLRGAVQIVSEKDRIRVSGHGRNVLMRHAAKPGTPDDDSVAESN